MRNWSFLVVPALVLIVTASSVEASKGLSLRLVTSVGSNVSANIAPAIAVDIEMGPDGTWSSTATELRLLAPRVRVVSNTNYSFRETASATGVEVSMTCATINGSMCPSTATSTTGDVHEYTPQLSQVIDYHRAATAGWRVEIVQTFAPSGV